MPLTTVLSYRMKFKCFNLVFLKDLIPIFNIAYYSGICLDFIACSLCPYFSSIDKNLSSLTWARRLRQIKEFHKSFIFHQMWFQVPLFPIHPTERKVRIFTSQHCSLGRGWGNSRNTHRGFVCSLQLSHSRKTSPAKYPLSELFVG